jgi:hypothetical protein
MRIIQFRVLICLLLLAVNDFFSCIAYCMCMAVVQKQLVLLGAESITREANSWLQLTKWIMGSIAYQYLMDGRANFASEHWFWS